MKEHPNSDGRGMRIFKPPVIEKIDVTEWLEIKQHSRGMYLSLNPKHARIYDLQQHDFLKITIRLVRKAPRDLDAEEGKQ